MLSGPRHVPDSTDRRPHTFADVIEELVNSFINNIYKLHSVPNTIISNHGTQFISDF